MVDWAWFTTIGYVGVFWTVFATKVVLFAAAFVGIGLASVGERNAGVAVCLAATTSASGGARPGLPDGPGIAGAPTELLGPASPRLPWRLIILAVALVIGLLIAIGETGKWDLILRFIYQVPYGQNDPLFDKDIGFYLFSLPVYIALKNWMLLILS